MTAKTDNPYWLSLAIKEIGTVETPGPRNNPKVVKYYLDVIGRGLADSVPWCAAFVGAMLIRAGEKSSGSLMARSYLRYGDRCRGQVGAIAVWPRGNSKIFGHVNFVERVDGDKVVCVGGNQADAVSRQTYSRRKALAFRWPSKKRIVP